MKTNRSLILLVALLLSGNFLSAQYLPNYSYEDAGFMWFSYPCTGADSWTGPCREMERQVKTEYPPWIINGGWRTYFLVDGKGTSVASSPASMTTSNEINFKDNGTHVYRATERSVCPGGIPWKLEYYCAYSAQYINHPTAGTVSVGFVEGENYGLPGVGDPISGCGYQDGDINTTFLCLAWTPNNQATIWGQQEFTDLGPFIWPATGFFLPNGQKSSYGCGNNATIQADGYMYVFYKDQSYEHIGAQMGDGRLPGIKVARAPISDALNPHAYKTFYEDASGVVHWNKSLPDGLTMSNFQNYYTTPGPQGTRLFETDRDYTRFAVARVTNTNYYLGVGSYQKNGKLIMTMKYSYDLVHWHSDMTLNEASSWETSKFNYPIFLSGDGTSNTHIVDNNFYIVGTNSTTGTIGRSVNRMHLWWNPPMATCYDQCGNEVPCPAPPPCPDCWCPEGRKATTSPVAALDNSKDRAPFVSPNPGPGVFQLKYTLKVPAKTQLKVLDLMGRQVQTGSAVNRMAGTYTETVNISSHAKGVYMLQLLVNGKKQTFKVISQ